MVDTVSGRLVGKVAIVTGAASGIGAGIAHGFAAEGATVILTDVQADRGAAIAAELGGPAEFSTLDVTDESAWRELVASVEARFGRLDVLVNNAGIVHNEPLETLSEADYRRVIDVNQVAVFLGMRAAVPLMKKRGAASIVNISSTAGIIAYEGVLGYVASKWAVRGMTKAAALELAKHGIRVNSVHPGMIATDMNAGTDADETALRQPFPFMGAPQDIAGIAIYLASDESRYATGAEFVVDGGYTAM